MGGVIGDNPCAKGPVPYCLDDCSKGDGARDRLVQLSKAIVALGPSYQGLETVLDAQLVSRVYTDPQVRQDLVEHLQKNWFNDNPPDAYFPQQQVLQKYAQGVLKAVELSLKGQPDPVPINAWWVIQADSDVKLLNLAEVENDVTVSDSVTLLIMTPKPQSDGQSTTRILGQSQAWVVEHTETREVTVRLLPNRPST